MQCRIALVVCLCLAGWTFAQEPWVTIRGQVVYPKDLPIPEPKELNVTADREHCLEKGPIKADDLLVDSKSRGIRNVWVYLRPDSNDRSAKFDPAKEIHPNLRNPEPKTFSVDQPCCMFVPRIFAIREGDFVEFKNSSPVSHNTNLSADEPSPSYNKTVAAGGSYKDPKPFMAQRSPIEFKCSIHPWMGGQFMVFDHPYFAVTDAEGKFEIKDAPAGKYRIVYRHEHGFHKGRDGALGLPLEIQPGPGGVMTIEPLEFQFPKR